MKSDSMRSNFSLTDKGEFLLLSHQKIPSLDIKTCHHHYSWSLEFPKSITLPSQLKTNKNDKLCYPLAANTTIPCSIKKKKVKIKIQKKPSIAPTIIQKIKN